ncbi:hypothetical protein PSQ39_06885 [Curvibacter sp. HBC28]|uniref:DUF2490 domain-containing protein n=1 Tax=Curvibacter microcysteis TaxID=3026419 RepID=A0ABT5MGX0_9BURK|nr:hypothetical protein [Curvibacter sp. HBC28]MDD0814351.1 hypothetical protein [Curvibacter sp. HBC28]
MRDHRPSLLPPWLTWALALALLGSGASSQAEPSYYLVTVYDGAGEMNVDFRYWTVDPQRGRTRVWPEIGLGYGVTRRWYTELFVSYVGERPENVRTESVNWQNDLLLTEGQYPFDLALHSNLALNKGPGSGRLLEFGPALQTEFGRTQVNTNLFWERSLQTERASRTQLKYQWQVAQHWRPGLHPGWMGFGELGPWDDLSPRRQQSHRQGPMVKGSLVLGPGQELRYHLGYLIGKAYGSQANMLTLRLQYVF